jgi:hypothetical protein
MFSIFTHALVGVWWCDNCANISEAQDQTDKTAIAKVIPKVWSILKSTVTPLIHTREDTNEWNSQPADGKVLVHANLLIGTV